MRLDVLLVERGLARSRKNACDLIDAERVLISGKVARKASASLRIKAASLARCSGLFTTI